MRHNRVENKLRRSIDFISAFAGEAAVAEATADVVRDLAHKLLLETANESQSCQGTPPQQRQNMIICICAFRRTPKSRILRLKTGLMPEIETCRRNFGNRKIEIPLFAFREIKIPRGCSVSRMN